MVLIEPKNFYVVYTNITCAKGIAFRRRKKGMKMSDKFLGEGVGYSGHGDHRGCSTIQKQEKKGGK
jgi:hypothetical protein